jgi:hypothetical protein
VLFSFRLAHFAAAKRVETEVARIQARGEPITSEDFYAFHKVPAGTRDITPEWIAALDALDEKALNSGGLGLPFVGDVKPFALAPDAPNSLFPAAEELLKNFAVPLDKIHAAAQLEGECRFPVEFSKGISALLPHAQKFRSVQRLLQLEARVRFHRGDLDGALQSVHDMLKTAQALDHQPTLIEHLVRVAVYMVAFSEIEYLLTETPLTEPQLARLQQQLQGLNLRNGLTTGMLGERGMGYHTFQHVNSLADIDAISGDGSSGGWESKVSVTVGRPADCEKYLELLGEMIAASREPFPEARQRVDQIDQKLKAMVGTRNPLEKLKYVVTSLLTPAINKAFDAIARVVARRDALVTAIAAERYRLKAGAFPTKLDELVPDYLPAVPTDPFSGQPLRMLASPEEVAIYSVGINGTDDQGVENEHRGEPDIVVRAKAAKGTP